MARIEPVQAVVVDVRIVFMKMMIKYAFLVNLLVNIAIQLLLVDTLIVIQIIQVLYIFPYKFILN